MNLPLPNSLQVEKPTGDYNAGLWYDKFFNGWDESLSTVSEGSKADWVRHAATGKCGEEKALSEQCRRLRNLVSTHAGQVLYFKTDGSFVTGLGREHPVENGFAWHHTLGVPYLPGSSLKGVLRAWAHEQAQDKLDTDRIFGPEHPQRTGVGSVIFFDAIPCTPVQLQADVMTPHYGPYYQDEPARTPPADWHDPVPIPFLVVAAAQTLLFALAPRHINNPQDSQDCEMVAGWLADALTWLGAGAKTAIGYGRFKFDQEATKAAAEAQRQAQQKRQHEAVLAARLQHLGPLAQELEREIVTHHLDTDKNAFSAPSFIDPWLDKLEATPTADALSRFSDLVKIHFPGLLENPNKLKIKKKKKAFAFKERQRRIAERLRELNDKKS